VRLSDLRPAPGARTPRTRVGRGHGSGHVKTAGRGQKGQKARTGSHIPAYFEGGQNRFSQRMPYMSRFKNRFRKQFAIVNLDQLRRAFEAGAEVNAETLAAKGLIDRLGRKEYLKILGDGALDRALRVRAHKVSTSARSKIEAAGGSVEMIEPPPPRDPKTKRAPKGSAPAGTTPAVRG
jgi:large subunit ribosomal protein L15